MLLKDKRMDVNDFNLTLTSRFVPDVQGLSSSLHARLTIRGGHLSWRALLACVGCSLSLPSSSLALLTYSSTA